MGCDVHTLVSVKKKVVAHDIAYGRSYATFGALAGVRSMEYEPIAEQRGLPSSITLNDKADVDLPYLFKNEYIENGPQLTNKYWLGEHSYSYLSLEEISKYCKKIKKKDDKEKLGMLFQIKEDLERIAKMFKVDASDVELVMGFDS